MLLINPQSADLFMCLSSAPAFSRVISSGCNISQQQPPQIATITSLCCLCRKRGCGCFCAESYASHALLTLSRYENAETDTLLLIAAAGRVCLCVYGDLIALTVWEHLVSVLGISSV